MADPHTRTIFGVLAPYPLLSCPCQEQLTALRCWPACCDNSDGGSVNVTSFHRSTCLTISLTRTKTSNLCEQYKTRLRIGNEMKTEEDRDARKRKRDDNGFLSALRSRRENNTHTHPHPHLPPHTRKRQFCRLLMINRKSMETMPDELSAYR